MRKEPKQKAKEREELLPFRQWLLPQVATVMSESPHWKLRPSVSEVPRIGFAQTMKTPGELLGRMAVVNRAKVKRAGSGTLWRRSSGSAHIAGQEI